MPIDTPAYQNLSSFSALLGAQQVTYCSKPGLPDWKEVTPAMRLLVSETNLAAGQQVLYLNPGHGAAAAALALANPGAQLTLVATHFTTQQAAQASLNANQAPNAHLAPTAEPDPQARFDCVLLDLPKGRSLARRQLRQAFEALLPGGALYLSGPKDLGVETVIKDAGQLFGPGGLLAYKKGNRIVRFTRPPALPGPGWWDAPGIAPHSWIELTLALPDGPLALVSLPGVFAGDHLDGGTELLLAHLPNPAGLRCLDVGCGNGVIGIHLARAGAASVDLLDDNLLAVQAAGENLRRLGLSQANALASDALSAVDTRRYDLVASNPPFHSGKGVDYHLAQAFINQSHAALDSDGKLVLVANQFIRYERQMRELFPRVELVVANRSFQVMMGIKSAPAPSPARPRRPRREE